MARLSLLRLWTVVRQGDKTFCAHSVRLVLLDEEKKEEVPIKVWYGQSHQMDEDERDDISKDI